MDERGLCDPALEEKKFKWAPDHYPLAILSNLAHKKGTAQFKDEHGNSFICVDAYLGFHKAYRPADKQLFVHPHKFPQGVHQLKAHHGKVYRGSRDRVTHLETGGVLEILRNGIRLRGRADAAYVQALLATGNHRLCEATYGAYGSLSGGGNLGGILQMEYRKELRETKNTAAPQATAHPTHDAARPAKQQRVNRTIDLDAQSTGAAEQGDGPACLCSPTAGAEVQVVAAQSGGNGKVAVEVGEALACHKPHEEGWAWVVKSNGDAGWILEDNIVTTRRAVAVTEQPAGDHQQLAVSPGNLLVVHGADNQGWIWATNTGAQTTGWVQMSCILFLTE